MKRGPRVLSVVMAFVVAGAAMAQVPAGERQALVDLYSATVGEDWHDSSGWLGPEGSECLWYGVTCNPEESAVTSLELAFNNLTGPLPATIGQLVWLEVLDLGHNSLFGPIPTAIGHLGPLTHLDLSENFLEGPIPAELGSLGQLDELVVNSNELAGPVPPELGTLASLRRLDLSRNHLTGPIPEAISGLSSLLRLDLAFNRLTGPLPATLGALTSLQELSLKTNLLVGTVPPTITALTALNSCSLWNNGLRTTDPTVAAFLDQRCGWWSAVQTVPPADITVERVSGVSLSLAWDPIAYSSGIGRYEVLIATDPLGPFLPAGTTVSKRASSLVVFGLEPSVRYWVAVRTVSWGGGSAPGETPKVVGELSEPVTAETSSGPSTWYVSPDGSPGNDCRSAATPCPTVQAACDRAADGEVVVLAPGVYDEMVLLASDLYVVGAGAETSIVDGGGTGPVITAQAGAEVHIAGVTIRNGSAPAGGCVLVEPGAAAYLTEAELSGCSAAMGGAIAVPAGGSASLEQTRIVNNSATSQGGGIWCEGEAAVDSCVIAENTAPDGAGVVSIDMMRVSGSIVKLNQAGVSGGGVLAVDQNDAHQGPLLVEGSSLVLNAAPRGGGLATGAWSSARMFNVTVSGNLGGGISVDPDGHVAVNWTTIVYNSLGPGLASAGEGADLRGCVVATNQPVDCEDTTGLLFSLGFNLDSDHSCGFRTVIDLPGADPELGPLDLHGGPTPTHLPSAESPIVDFASPGSSPDVDQRLVERPIDGDQDGVARPDIGAVELIPPIFADGFESGDLSVWDIGPPSGAVCRRAAVDRRAGP